jgi:hypothetical protein
VLLETDLRVISTSHAARRGTSIDNQTVAGWSTELDMGSSPLKKTEHCGVQVFYLPKSASDGLSSLLLFRNHVKTSVWWELSALPDGYTGLAGAQVTRVVSRTGSEASC